VAGATRRSRIRGILGAGTLAAVVLAATGPGAQQALPADRIAPSPNSYGMPGLIDMPVAQPFPDGRFALTGTAFPGTARVALAFQIAPRLTGSFRYSRIDRPRLGDRLFDRSFDIQFLLLEEGPYRPAVAVGLRDFIGTGEYASEYLVATKQITPRLRVTGGIGWGRIATENGFSNPLGVLDDRFRTRPGGFTGSGGRVEFTRFFRGDAALFGGIEYQATDRLRLVAEVSGDGYPNETGGADPRWRHRMPVNLGASYALGPRTTVTGYVLHGGTFALTASVAFDPGRPLRPVRVDAPVPMAVRPAPPAGADWSTDWVEVPAARPILRQALAAGLTAEGLRLESFETGPRRAVVGYTNLRHETPARALGRAARVLAEVLPHSVEEFVLVSAARGMPVTSVTLRRSDLEALEHAPDGAETLLARAAIADGRDAAGGALLQPHPPEVARLGWSLLPYVQPSLMDPSAPLRADLGLRAEARYALAANLLVSGALTQRIAGNLSGTTRALEACRSDGFCYERVRSEAPLYSSDSPVLERLTIEHFSRPGPDLFGRLSAGWLERMYGGVSAELLWKPVASRLALGAEVNHVRRRSPDSFAGFLDYSVTTGNVSAYYDLGAGYTGQLDVGRYLAGDVGATLTFTREFASGWRIGAYATITDMPFSAFGEGSFDKGITITVPVSWFDGRPSRARNTQTIRSLARDGGARLEVENRLHPVVRDLQRGALTQGWGTIWQ
jgi:hypothetical protein